MTEKEKREIINELKKELLKPKKVYVEVCRDDITLPIYANESDAGMDLRSAVDTEIEPGETKVIPTGLKLAIPEGYEIQIRPRSGLSLKTPLRIANSPGTIDAGYRDELGIIVNNSSVINKKIKYDINEKGNKEGTYVIKKGDRIAQMVLNKIEKIEFIKVQKGEIEKIGNNRGGGFGHTGIK